LEKEVEDEEENNTKTKTDNLFFLIRYENMCSSVGSY
jgi:hypothetical protein